MCMYNHDHYLMFKICMSVSHRFAIYTFVLNSRSTAKEQSRKALRTEIDESLEKARRLREKYIEERARKASVESEKVSVTN